MFTMDGQWMESKLEFGDFRPRLSQRLKPLSKSLSTLKGTIRELVGESLTMLLVAVDGLETSALLY
ncbi:MAG: hypothetical protein DRR08_28060 [Candidatus Parabeggiatoa sp. nov. 2]|nr:MAG: hypothetical protein B6247_26575 [Beggiatoa sp. 4572_84]RKZ52655.1 MAG: hypothetical protein DRR08_28060 [Gammaproteobacteria bacterium]